MALTINGKFISSLPVEEGEGQRGHWVRGGFVIEYGEEYPHKLAFQLFGEDRVNMVDGMANGMPVQVTFVPESTESNGRWFSNNRCLKVVALQQAQPMQAQPQYPYAAQAPQAPATQQAQPMGTVQPGAVPFPMAGAQQQGQGQQPVQMPANGEGDLPF